MLKKILTITLLFTLSLGTLSACQKKGTGQNNTQAADVTLTFYGLFDDEEVYTPMISAYEKAHPNVNILYKKFTDPDLYWDLIVNELAEGEGPDIFMMHNSWFPQHYKKLTPAPDSLVNTEVFKSSFVDIVSHDLVIPDENGAEKVWGMPLYVDTLALYYNNAHFEDALASQGKPSSTWDGIKEDVVTLSKQDQSFERFSRAGIALGRADNILRAFDTLMLMMLQNNVYFYNDDYTKVLFGNDPGALAALQLYTSFGLPSQKNYSWNKYLADADSAEKELTTFAKGKLSMLLGYSYAYEAILNEVQRLKKEGEDTININDLKIQEVPQLDDPEISADSRVTYASYFVPVVSRTTAHSEEAWDFLLSMVDEDSLRVYNESTHRSSALRSLIDEQKVDPIYGVFASQVGYAKSITMANSEAYQSIFLDGITNVLNTARPEDVLRSLAEEIQALIPTNGIKPTYVAPPDDTANGS